MHAKTVDALPLLLAFLRDYLYVPLGGGRVGKARRYLNLMITMLLGGLWHGAAWTFVIWGGLHGSAMVWERWRRDRRGPVERIETRWATWRARIVTFHFVCFAWIFFRADSFTAAWDMIAGLFTRWGEA